LRKPRLLGQGAEASADVQGGAVFMAWLFCKVFVAG